MYRKKIHSYVKMIHIFRFIRRHICRRGASPPSKKIWEKNLRHFFSKKCLTFFFSFFLKKVVLEPSETYATKIFLKKKIEKKCLQKKFEIFSNILKIFVVKSSETYATKIIPSALFEEGGVCWLLTGKSPDKVYFTG